jgi:hypothetical protein
MGFDVSERVVGLTVVAIGTSLPELAVSLAAALKKQQEMAVANVVGSNIFNLLMILGVTGLARPLPIDPRIVSVDLWVMMGFTVLLLPLAFRRRTLTRGGGACLLLTYAFYVAWLAWNPRKAIEPSAPHPAGIGHRRRWDSTIPAACRARTPWLSCRPQVSRTGATLKYGP